MKKYLIALFTIFFTACVYYNTLYNANKLFKEANSAPLNNGRISASTRQKYDKVLKKCGYIVTEHKNSQYADDALFLLARCLFYKNNMVQAKEKFLDLKKFYPKFEKINEADLYIAKCDYKLNKKQSAFSILQKYILNSKDNEKKAKALVLTSQWYAKEGKHSIAETYLKQIIEKYPDTEEYKNAFFNLGKVAYENKEYLKSQKIFEDLLKASIDRPVKLDARFYIIKCDIMLNNFEIALKKSEKLLELEYRTKKLLSVKLVLARSLAGLKQFDEAEKEFKNILETEKNTELGAETSFYLAEMYFLGKQNYDDAIKAYNAVKQKFRKSPFTTDAMAKSRVATQIVQFKKSDKKINSEKIANQSFKLAEYYIDVLNMPDSAFVVYKSLETQKNNIALKIDTLYTSLDTLKTKAIQDSIAFVKSDSTKTDSIKISYKNKYQPKITSVKNRINQLNTAIESYNNEYIPFSKFVMAWFLKEKLNNPDSALAIKKDLEKNYKNNIWTFAINDYYAGKPVVLKTPSYIALENKLDNALKISDINSKIDTLLAIQGLNLEPELENRRDFTVGFIYLNDLHDTLSCKPYFKKIMESSPNSKYDKFIKEKLIFKPNSDNINILGRLPYLVKLEKDKQIADSLKAKQLADSLKAKNAADSIKTNKKPKK